MARKGMVKWVCSLACAAVALALAFTLAPALPQANATEAQASSSAADAATDGEATGDTQERTAVDVGLEKQGESLDGASSEEELAESTAEPAIQLTADGVSILRATSQLKNGAALALEMNGIVVISVTTPVYVTFGAENAYDIEADAPLDTFTATAPVTFQNTGTAYARMAGITCTDRGATDLLTKDGTTPIDADNRIFHLSNGTDTPVSFGPVAGESSANTVAAADLGTSFDIPDKSDTTTSGAKTFTYTLDLTDTQVNTSAVDAMEVGGSVSMELASVVYTFEAATTTITWNAGEGVFKSTNENTLVETPNYATSATVTLPTEAPERDGYTFLGWFTEATGGTQVVGGETPLPTVPTTYYAHWEVASFTVTFDANYAAGEGAQEFVDGNSPQIVTVEKGSTVTAPALTARDGYECVGWYVEGDTEQTIVDLASTTVTGNITYKAKWALFQAYAVYGTDNADAGTLVFLKSATAPAAGSTYTFTNAAGTDTTVTVASAADVYTGFEEGVYTSTTVPWSNDKGASSFTRVAFLDDIQPKNTAYWFNGFTNCTEIVGLNNLDTSNVTNMASMFQSCSSLTTLDVTGFNTANVTNMQYMFGGCSNLTSLDVTCFDTTKVTSMNGTFSSCSGLTSLDLSHFITADVTNMSYMFQGCSGLTSLDVSNFNTAKVTTMEKMFYNCKGLTALDMSSFDTANVTKMGWMFQNCSALKTLGVSGFDTTNVQAMTSMFNGCSKLTSLDVSKFNTAKVTNMASMFQSCSGLTALDVSNFDTANVTNMSYMFGGCSNLTSLDVTCFDTTKVTSMNGTFSSCSGLTSLDLSHFITANVTNMSYMFKSCTTLKTIYAGNSWSTGAVTSSTDMFTYCTNLVGSKGTAYSDKASTDPDNANDKTYARIDGKEQAEDGTYLPGYLSEAPAYAIYSAGETANTGTLTFLRSTTEPIANSSLEYEDGEGNPQTLTVTDVYTGIETDIYASAAKAPWHSRRSEIQSVTFQDTIKPVSTAYWFNNMAVLDTITNLTSLNTTNVINMISMFNGCSGLKTLDVSHFDTSNVTNMNSMFMSCSALTTLDVSQKEIENSEGTIYTTWNTSSVTNMGAMFRDCKGLSTIVVSHFDTRAVTDMNRMFIGCSGLTQLNVSHFNTHAVTDMCRMFNGCSALTTLDVSQKSVANSDGTTYTTWDTANVKDMNYMFNVCSSLTSLDVTTFNTASVLDMSGMFSGCSQLTSLNVSSFNTTSVTNMSYMFSGCSTLDTLDVSNFDTTNVTDMNTMFSNCQKVAELDVGNWNTSKVKYMSYMFRACYVLTTLDVSAKTVIRDDGTTYTTWDTSNVTDMAYMFQNCRVLDVINVSKFNTANVTNMSTMFSNCQKVAELDVSRFDTTKVTNMGSMFNACSSLVTLDVSKKTLENSEGASYTTWDTANVTDMDYMFYVCSSLTTLDVSQFNTNKVEKMKWMFSGCKALEALDVSNFDTHAVTDMSWMFRECQLLTELDVSRFNTSAVTDMNRMFYGCSNLETLDASSFNTANVKDMSYMFSGCKNLTTIYVGSSWSTGNVTESANMFTSCTSLVGSKGTACNGTDNIDATYARIDYQNQAGDGSDNLPGYLSYKTVYTVTFDPAGGTFSDGETSSTDPKEVKYYPWEAASATITAPTETLTLDGYDFVGWFTEATGGTQLQDGESPTASITYYAHWEEPPTFSLKIVDTPQLDALTPYAGKTYSLDDVVTMANDIAANYDPDGDGNDSDNTSSYYAMFYAMATDTAEYGTNYTCEVTWKMKTSSSSTEYDTPVSYPVRIIGVNHDDLANGTGKAGLTFQFGTLLSAYAGGTSGFPMNSTNTNAYGWGKSQLRANMNNGTDTDINGTDDNLIWNMVPTEQQSVFQTVSKPYAYVESDTIGNGGEQGYSSDQLFIASYCELAGETYSASYPALNEKEGAQYVYYQTHEGSTENSYSALIRVWNGTSTAFYWWERSCFPNLADRFLYVYSNGNPSNNVSVKTPASSTHS